MLRFASPKVYSPVPCLLKAILVIYPAAPPALMISAAVYNAADFEKRLPPVLVVNTTFDPLEVVAVPMVTGVWARALKFPAITPIKSKKDKNVFIKN